MIPRTIAAFEFSVDRLHAQTGELYFWTFTFKECISDDDAMLAWANLFKRRAGRMLFGKCPGIRVIELHKFHGVHFHVLFNKRIAIEEVLRLAGGLGFGRISVEKVRDKSRTKNYLKKYLRKDFMREHWRKGRRRWAGINGFDNTRCKDLTYDGPYQRNKALFYGTRSVSGGWQTAKYLMGCSVFGDFAEWPLIIQEGWLRRFRELVPMQRRRGSGVEMIL